MLSHQARRGTLHGIHIERQSMPPRDGSREQRTRIPRDDAIRVGTRASVKTGGEPRARMIYGVQGDIGGQQGRHGAHPTGMRDGKLIGMRGNAHILRYGVNTGIRTTGARQIDRSAQERLERPSNLARHGPQALGLLGKSAEGGTVITQAEYERPIELIDSRIGPGHGQGVNGGGLGHGIPFHRAHPIKETAITAAMDVRETTSNARSRRPSGRGTGSRPLEDAS
ncbi:Uncharacterised protein [Collinsella intestinalis]|nr:Uncharacterised protein [Collinsella intestinalis]